MRIKGNIYSLIVVSLIAAELFVILISWIVTAAFPGLPLHSLLSGSGIRWLFNSFTDNVTTPFVIWIVLFSMVCGLYKRCGVKRMSLHNMSFRERLALRTVMGEAFLALCVLLLMTVMPHAVLLSVSGNLLTVPFLLGLVPALLIVSAVLLITYGSITRKFTSVSSVLNSMAYGVSLTSHVWIPYILVMVLFHSVMYVII